MKNKYPAIDRSLNFSVIDANIRRYWEANDVFHKMCEAGKEAFVFYEGPPSANGLPGIHHMLSRTTKDVVLRYKAMCGYNVSRRCGWDTHGLPIELQVEKSLGITKKDIGKSISIQDYNKACRETVSMYINEWNAFSRQMGYAVDLDNPYITCDTEYIESVWHIIGEIYKKGLLAKRYLIQPYSPAAGTSLSSHELNQPGCYKEIKDTAVTVKFRLTHEPDTYLLAWTTTPYTLPANAALAVHRDMKYYRITTKNAKTGLEENYILSETSVSAYFDPRQQISNIQAMEATGSSWCLTGEFSGQQLTGVSYQPILHFVTPTAEEQQYAYKVYHSDHVKEDGGTGIVHISPAFGAEDFRLHISEKVPLFMVPDATGEPCPLIDREGKFAPSITNWAGRYFRNGYAADPADDVNKEISMYLDQQGLLFKTELYAHVYPHCWRTDKPILYYPIHSWQILVSRIRDKLMALNETINWVPANAGTSRFGNWLENLQDWNLGRTRYWGTPLPVWTTKKGDEVKCISGIDELKREIDLAVEKGFMEENPLSCKPSVDLHRPYIDDIILVSGKGEKMYREEYVVDVWLDAGAMPYAQQHFPFGNKELFFKNFPADFIAEGVDQTRGWFYTLHVLGAILFDSVAFRNVLCHGLVLDKTGVKMSKRLGNVVDPVEMMKKHGADAVRLYIIKQTAAGDNLHFNAEELIDIKNKFLGTLVNTFNFFCLYANTDEWSEINIIPLDRRPLIDRWMISHLQHLVASVTEAFEKYRLSDGVRALYEFVINDLSNWYVRLNRKRFWYQGLSEDKLSAYSTLHEVLLTVVRLLAPVCPFISEEIYRNLQRRDIGNSVHLEKWPQVDSNSKLDEFNESMDIVRAVCSAGHNLRKKAGIKVRQPLQHIYLGIANNVTESRVRQYEELLLQELNIKEAVFMNTLTVGKNRCLRPNYEALGKRMKSKIKILKVQLSQLNQAQVNAYINGETLSLTIDQEVFLFSGDDLQVVESDISSDAVVVHGGDVVVLIDLTITDALELEGIARDSVKKIQELRKELGLNITDRINVRIPGDKKSRKMVMDYGDYICRETLANNIHVVEDGNWLVSGAMLEIEKAH